MPKSKRAGKVKDKWREKHWVTVLASPGFERAPIAYVPITNDEIAAGKVIETTLLFSKKRSCQTKLCLAKLRPRFSSKQRLCSNSTALYAEKRSDWRRYNFL